MDPILLDTNAYAAFKRGNAEAVAVLRRAPRIAVSTIVLGELLGGFAAGSREQDNRDDLAKFLATPRVVVVPVDRAIAELFAAAYAALRKTGTPVPSNDLWIAATALQHQLRIFTYDAHFSRVPGLRAGASLAELTAP